jgi:simple sugar transport system permease protein
MNLKRIGRALLIPSLALVVALLVGAVIMLLSGDNPLQAYAGLVSGAFGSPRGWDTTARKMTPLILTGLSVAVGFKAGLFNIGASGQFMLGTVCSVAVGINFEGMPAPLHVTLALLAGVAGGMFWGFIPGILKVTTGAHEVIVTIMLNYIASLLAQWLVYAGGSQGQSPGPLWDPTAGPISETPDVLMSARLPQIFPDDPTLRIHYGIVIVFVVAIAMWWLLFKTTRGFEIRTVGLNSGAARYGGMQVNWIIVFSMMLAGGLAGLAGAIETLGLNHKFAPEFAGGVGFDGITVALLGQTHPFGIVISSFLLTALDAGASKMQFDSGISADIIQVIQALILAFVAAPTIIRSIFRIRKPADEVERTVFSSGWGG